MARQSRPVWGAWIEIIRAKRLNATTWSRPVWGAWIEMIPLAFANNGDPRRAPYGARGLKLRHQAAQAPAAPVAPRMGRVD